MKRALSELIWLHGEVGSYQVVQGSLQFSKWLLREGCEEGQHQQGLTLKSWERTTKEMSASFTLLRNPKRRGKNGTVVIYHYAGCDKTSITLRLSGRFMSTSSIVKVENTTLNASWLISEHTEESIWWDREKGPWNKLTLQLLVIEMKVTFSFRIPVGVWRAAEELQFCSLELKNPLPTTTGGSSIFLAPLRPAFFPESSSRNAL